MRPSPRGGGAVAAALLLLALAAGGCVSAEEGQRQPDAPDDGMQATGVIDGRRVVVSSGEPVVLFGDCDPGDGLDRDLCIRVQTIDGVQLNLVIENPSALSPGEEFEVRADPCDTCDDIRTHLVVELRIDGEARRVSSGDVTVGTAGQRFAADFDLRLPSGDRLTGAFNVRVAVGGS